jgi:hypothetical protein
MASRASRADLVMRGKAISSLTRPKITLSISFATFLSGIVKFHWGRFVFSPEGNIIQIETNSEQYGSQSGPIVVTLCSSLGEGCKSRDPGSARVWKSRYFA